MALHESYHDCPNWIAVGCICKPQEKASAPPAPERDIAQTAERATHAAECMRMRAKMGNMRRALRQLNKAHATLWRVMGLQAEAMAKFRMQDASVPPGSSGRMEKK